MTLLERWGSALNLTSRDRRTRQGLDDLVEDSLCILPYLPRQLDRLIDLGSGQGFPAIPIAIETGIRIELIESDRRKAAFLTTAMAELNLDGSVHATRIEATSMKPAPCVTARALASMADLIVMAKPFLVPGGSAFFLKGAAVAQELRSVALHDDMTIEILATARPPSTLVKVTSLG